jgi:hypothetical protein
MYEFIFLYWIYDLCNSQLFSPIWCSSASVFVNYLLYFKNVFALKLLFFT